MAESQLTSSILRARGLAFLVARFLRCDGLFEQLDGNIRICGRVIEVESIQARSAMPHGTENLLGLIQTVR